MFKRVKAYNLVQHFEFLTVTFELYYERRLLAVAHNRMDRYISLRYIKGLGVVKVNQDSIHQSTNASHVYLVKSIVYADKEYEVDTQKWTCTCTVGRTGYPRGQNTDHDEGAENLDMMLNVMDDQEKLKQDVLTLGNAFVEDVRERMGQMDTQYLTGLQNFYSIYYGHRNEYRTNSLRYSKTCIATSYLLFSTVFINIHPSS